MLPPPSPRPFYVTTPIYYVNDIPHLGHAYTTTVCDALRRYARVRGRDARMLTGTDEHGLKIERVAKESGKSPQAFVDAASKPFRMAWPVLDIEADDFIRTTEPRHIAWVHELWKRIAEKGFLEEGSYEDWYCVGCESFKTEKELLPGNLCPVHQKPVERVKEQTYFFKLSQFEERLLAFYEKHPQFIQPETRRNEVLSFVRSGLRDLSVSRTSFSWGIPVPGDPKHVMYVWFDALSNYRSALAGRDSKGESLARFWPPSAEAVHIVGKDILRFHAVYWPAFLMAAGYGDDEMPTAIVAHGFLTIDGQKMSKSLRNGVDPLRLARELGPDVLRYYLLRAISFGQDGDFDHAGIIERYNADLGKNLGNLLARTLGLCVKMTESQVPPLGEETELERELGAKVEADAKRAAAHWDAYEPHLALEATWAISAALNQYVDRAAPWALAKAGNTARVHSTLLTLLRTLERLSVCIWPAMPKKANELRAQLGLGPIAPNVGRDLFWSEPTLMPGMKLAPSAALFPTYDEASANELLARLRPPETITAASLNEGGSKQDKTKTPSGAAEKKMEKPEITPESAVPSTEASPLGPISYDQFSVVDLRVGLVLTCTKVPKKDRLLQLSVDLGEAEPRTIIAGLALTFAPEALVGRRVLVVANLAPRDFGKGLVSHGMIMAAGPSEKLVLPTIDDSVAPGSKLK
ncbi:MAG: methionine--tRNA ligase [Polyangiaceae bacterium]